MGWSDTARQAAAAEHGRQNASQYAARRRVGFTAAGVAVLLLIVGRSWDPSWSHGAVAVGVTVLVVAAIAGALAVGLLVGRSFRRSHPASYRVRVPRRYR